VQFDIAKGDEIMTLVALWYRKDENDIYAIADSRLVGNYGTLSDQTPKFTTARVVCYTQNRRGHYDLKILDRQIAIGYAGSASVAFATIATLQAYLSSLTSENGKTPGLRDISDLASRILDQNFREFGTLWKNDAKCDLVIFGYLPIDKQLKCFYVGSNLIEGEIVTQNHELQLASEMCVSFGSCSEFFMARLRDDMARTGNFHPFNLLNKIIDSGERLDIGGYVQVAIANKSDVILPHVIKERYDRGEYAADITFLGRDISAIGNVGNCKVGKEAVGPDLKVLLENRKKAGY
jgi:hypothetical protein